MPAKKQTRKTKSRVASFKRLKNNPKYKSTTLFALLALLAVIGYFVIKSFAAAAPPRNTLTDRFCGTWVLKEAATTTQLTNVTNTIKQGLSYQNMRGLSFRTNWSSIDSGGVFNPAIFNQAKSIVAVYPSQDYTIRVIAGSKSPARLFAQSGMHYYLRDADNNLANGDQEDALKSPKVPLPYNPSSTGFEPNLAFEAEYTKLVDSLVAYAQANNIKLIHMPWYGRDWAELNYHDEMLDDGLTIEKWLSGHKRLADIVYERVKNYPDLSVEFPLSGWNSSPDGRSATTQLLSYMLDAGAHPQWANWSGRLLVQGNGYGKYSGLDANKGTPTAREAYRGMQMYDQFDNYTDLWAQMYRNLGSDPLYGTYLEVYAESFGYTAANQANLQAAITEFATTRCGPTDTSAPEVAMQSPAQNAKISGEVQVGASASDDTGVTKVEFYIDNALASSDSTSPYEYSWDTTTVTSGTHTVYAKAYDASSKSANSAAVTVTKPSPNQPPAVSLTSPSASTVFYAPATISIDATAADTDGSISKVEFFNGETKLAEDATAPYEYSWPGVAAGTYVISVRATDDADSSSLSTPVSVTVTNPAISIPAPSTAELTVKWDWGKWNNYLLATWAPPVDKSQVSGYKVKVLANGTLKEFNNISGASTASHKVYGLVNGATYKVQVFSVGKNSSDLSKNYAERTAKYTCAGTCWLIKQ